MSVEQQFENQLEVFRKECEEATQFFYTFRTVHEVAKAHRHVLRYLNENPLFWNTIVGALQTSSFIALGRIFDQNSPYNLDKVLQIARNNPVMFSKAALGQRKGGNQRERPGWLDRYLQDAYMPTATDFRRLKKHIKKYRRIYESNYRELRHKLYAHKAVSGPAEISALLAKTRIREMEQLFVFLLKLHEALWQLFVNGRKPVLRQLRWSAKRLSNLAAAPSHGGSAHEAITIETVRVLMTCVPQPVVISL